MAIEVEMCGEQEVRREYPYLARHENGAVVLFTKKKTGVCVKQGPTDEIGVFSKEWFELDFTPLSPSESITLSNKA